MRDGDGPGREESAALRVREEGVLTRNRQQVERVEEKGHHRLVAGARVKAACERHDAEGEEKTRQDPVRHGGIDEREDEPGGLGSEGGEAVGEEAWRDGGGAAAE